MGELEEEIRNILKLIYKIAAEIVFSIHSVDKDFVSRVGVSLEKYKVGHLIGAFQSSADAVSKLVLFFEDYIELILKGLEFFSNLAFALGIKNYNELVSQKVKLDEVIQLEKIDLGFLKFQIRTTEELIYPQIEEGTLKAIEDLNRLREVYFILDSETINKFMEELEKQERNWNKLQNMLNLCFLAVEKEEDKSTCIKKIAEVINEVIIFTANLRNMERNINHIVGEKGESPIERVNLFLEIIRQLGRDLITLVNCRAKGAEYISGSFIYILTILWGSQETAHRRFQQFIKSEISLEELIPPKILLEDLSFALMQVRNQLLQAVGAHQRVQETINAMKDAADYFNSPILREYYKTIAKEIEIINKYLPQYNQKVIQLQNILHKNIHKKTI
ncbi:MAG: hypothetical protein QW279_09225 [Candidatus Jordarchaeaceae archaeon]